MKRLCFLALIVVKASLAFADQNITICSGETKQLQPSKRDADKYIWSPKEGLDDSTKQSPTITLINTGDSAITKKYTLKALKINNNKDTDTVTETVQVTVNPVPGAADFTMSQTTVCSGSPVTFSTTPVDGFSYSWNFGDGSGEVKSNSATHTFNSTGSGNQTYTVRFRTYNSTTNCYSEKQQTISIKQAPDVMIFNFDHDTAKQFTNCGGSAFVLNVRNKSTTKVTNNSYTIDWGDDSPVYSSASFANEITHTYTNQGYFTIIETVIGTNGCTANKTFKAFNGSNPAITLGNPGGTTALCVPVELKFPLSGISTNPPGTTYTFATNSGDLDVTYDSLPSYYSHIFTKTSAGYNMGARIPNSFYVEVIAKNPCGTSLSKVEPITTSSKPKSKIEVLPDTIVCINSVVTLTNISVAGSIVDGDGKVTTTTLNNWIIEPSSNWSVSSGQLGNSNPDNDPDTWGSKELQVLFTQSGTYFVKLITRNYCGNDTAVRKICVQSPIVPQFSATPAEGCAPTTVVTTNTSTPIDECEPSTFAWAVTYSASYCGTSASYSFVDSTSVSSKSPHLKLTNPGIYTLSLTTKNRCPAQTVSHSVSVKKKPEIALVPIQNICGPAPVSITPAASVKSCGTSAVSYAWTFGGGTPASSTLASPGTISISGLGQHTVTLSAQNECGTTTENTSFTVIDPPKVNAGNDTAICAGGTASLKAIASGGLQPYSYTWSGAYTGQNVYPKPLLTTNYTVTVSDANKCTGTDEVKVTVNPLPVVSVASTSICKGTSATLTATGADTYKWSNGAIGASITVAPTTTMVYGVTGTKNGCEDSTSATVTVLPLPVVNAGRDTSFCNQAIAQQLKGFSPAGGVWSGTGVTAAGMYTPPTTEGRVTLVYSYTNTITLCKNIDTLVVNVVKPQSVNAGDDFSICENEAPKKMSATPEGGTWIGKGLAGSLFSPRIAGIGRHVLTYTYGGGSCINKDSLIVTVKNVPDVKAVGATICFGNSVSLSASGADIYSWTPTIGLSASNVATVVASPLVTTLYTIIGKNSDGCLDTTIISVKVNLLPTVDAGPDRLFCNQDIPISLNSTSGTWSGNPGLSGSTGSTFNPSKAGGVGTYNLILTDTDANNCTNRDTMKATIELPKTITIDTNKEVCNNVPNFTLKSEPQGGSWTEGGRNISNIFSPNSATIGLHTLIYSYGKNTCLVQDSVLIKVKTSPIVNVAGATICVGDSVKLTASGADKYSWRPATGLSDVDSNIVFAKPTISTTYNIVGETANGCSDTAVAMITVNQLPIVEAGLDQEFCNQNIPFQLTGFNPSIGGTWSGKGISTNGLVTPTNAGIGTFYYTLTYTNSKGCTNKDSLKATIITPTIADAGRGFWICIDASPKTLTGFSPSSGSTCKWTGLGITDSTFNPQQAGIGEHVLTYSYGENTCFTSDTIHVKVNELPNVSVNNGGICNGKSARLQAHGAHVYSWSPPENIVSVGADSLIVNPPGTKDYIVTGTDTITGCKNTAKSRVDVRSLPQVEAGADQEFCHQNIPFQLTNFTPISNGIGEWSGKIVSASGVVTPTLADTGTYYLSYTFTDSYGCVNKDSLKAVVKLPTFANAGTGFWICIDASQKALTGFTPSVGGVWSGDGVNGTIFNPSSANAGEHVLKYTFGDKTCFTFDTIHVKVNDLPKVNAGANDTTCISSLPFALRGALPLGGTWSGSGIVDTKLGLFSPSLAGVGEKRISYYFKDTITGCDDIKDKIVRVGALPVVSFSQPSIVCEKVAFNINNTSSGASSYRWNFGDGNTLSATNPSHVYDSIGFYVLSVIARSEFGCIDSLKHSVEVIAPPQSKFSLSPAQGCAPLNVTFTNNSIAKYETYLWNFGNGRLSNDTFPSTQNYNQGTFDTTYYVNLEVKNQCGVSKHKEPVLVYPKPHVDFGMSQTYGCSPLPIKLIDTITGYPKTMTWLFGDGTPSVTSNKFGKEIRHTFTYTGATDTVYFVKLISSNDCGVDSASHQIRVHANTVHAYYSVDTSSGCGPLTVHFTNYSGNLRSFWDFGDGNISNEKNPTHIFTKSGTYKVSLAVTNGCSYDTVWGSPITVFPDPISSFSCPDYVCYNSSVNFINGSPNIVSSKWDFGDNTPIDNAFNQNHLYNSAGEYSVKLTTANFYGCTTVSSKKVTIRQLPTVDAGNDLLFCNQAIPFQLKGKIPLSGGIWSGRGVTSGGVFLPSKVGESKSYLYFSYTDSFGCNNVDSMIATVVAPQFADAGNNFNLCINAGTKPLDNFSPVGGTWSGYGLDGTIFHPEKAGIGTHVLKYIYGENTCYTQDSIVVTVYPLPSLNTGSNDSLCISSPDFILKDFSPIGGVWSGNGIINSNTNTFSPQLSGIGKHVLTYSYVDTVTGCSNSQTKQITIKPLPFVDFQIPSVVCVNNQFSVVNKTQNANTYHWSFGDGTTMSLVSPSYQYDTTKIYTIKLVANSSFGCVDSLSKTVEVIDKPIATLNSTTPSGCSPLSVAFTNLSQGQYVSYQWNFNNGHFSVDETPPTQIFVQGFEDTTYTISLEVKNQCGISSASKYILVYPKPTVDFALSQYYGCSPLNIRLLDRIKGYPDVLTWDFGDGSPNVDSRNFNNDITHTYFFFGEKDTTYFVKLHASNQCGSDSSIQALVVHSKNINAFFTPDTLIGCSPLSIKYVNHSGSITAAFWDFGDGNISTDVNPSHTYQEAGSYKTRLIVTNGCSYDTTVSPQITVMPNPQPSFTFLDSVCARREITFKNLSDSVTGIKWDFGDGQQSDLTNPAHTFNKSGIYSIELFVTNRNNCKSSKALPLHVMFTPSAEIQTIPSAGCTPLSVELINITDSLTYNTYIWNLKNSSTSVAVNPPTQIFNNSSFCSDTVFFISLIAKQAHCSDTVSTSITVHPKPFSSFTVPNDIFCGFESNKQLICKQQSICANDYLWTVNNVNTSRDTNAVLSLPNVGLYSVALIAKNQYLCSDTASIHFKLYPSPTLLLDQLSIVGCEPLQLKINTRMNDELNYEWYNSDDKLVYSSPYFSHVFKNDGVYSMDVKISAPGGCSTEIKLSDSIRVNPRAQPSFSYVDLYQEDKQYNGSLFFTNTSKDASIFIWNFGDGEKSFASDTVLHRYAFNDSYQVTLFANNQYNCPDSVTETVDPNFFYGLFIPNALFPNHSDELMKVFKPIGIGLKTFHIQVFDTWGNIIWESSALDENGRPVDAWNGKGANGIDLPMDVYVWKTDNCIFKNDKIWEGMTYGKTRKNSGTITLIR